VNEEIRNYLDGGDEDVLRSSKERVHRESETARIRRLQIECGHRLVFQGGDPRRFADEVVWKGSGG